MNLLPEMDFEVEVWSIWGGGDDTCLREYKAALTPQLLTTRCSSAPGHAQQWTSKIRRPWVPGTPGQARPGACCIAQCPRGRCLYFQDRTIGHQALCSVRPKAVGRNGSDRGSHCDARKGIFLRGDVEQLHADLLQKGPSAAVVETVGLHFLSATLGTSNHQPPGYGGLSIGAVMRCNGVKIIIRHDRVPLWQR